MKIQNLFFILIFLLLFIPLSYAQEQQVNVDIEINTHETQDAKVVGDAFYYSIKFTNTGAERIDTIFNLSIFNPSKHLIHSSTRLIILEPNNSKVITVTGALENETAAFPFDTSGDYKIEIKAREPIHIYRWFTVEENGVTLQKYIRQNTTFNYFFDVMPRWEYEIWKSTKEANQKIIDANTELIKANKKLLNLTTDLNESSKNMQNATNAMFWVAVITASIAAITAYVAFKTYSVSKYMKKTL